jgi:hypothetical protein
MDSLEVLLHHTIYFHGGMFFYKVRSFCLIKRYLKIIPNEKYNDTYAE